MSERVALVGVDWGDKKHVYEVRGADGKRRRDTFESSPEAVHAWVAGLRSDYPSGTIAVAVEQSRGALIFALSRYEFLDLLPVAPARTAAYRAVARPSGAKTDSIDTGLICDYAEKHGEALRPLVRADDVTRELMVLTESRRKFVDQRVSFCNQLRDTLKQYFPQALAWSGDLGSPMSLDFLETWPTLDAIKRSRTSTIRTFYERHRCRSGELVEARLSGICSAIALHSDRALIDALSAIVAALVPIIRTISAEIAQLDRRIEQLWATHPDRAIFASFPGAGQTLAPRLAVAFGTDRSRWTAESMQTFSGIAPVMQQSGSKRWVHSRWCCPKFIRQTFHEFAAWSIPQCQWAATFYKLQRSRGKGHHAAVRALAFRWIRILVRCWKDRKPYDDEHYTRRLAAAGSPAATVPAA